MNAKMYTLLNLYPYIRNYITRLNPKVFTPAVSNLPAEVCDWVLEAAERAEESTNVEEAEEEASTAYRQAREAKVEASVLISKESKVRCLVST